VSLTIQSLLEIPLIMPGDDLASIILEAAARAEISFQDQDVLVIASKIVSRSEGRFASLSDVIPSEPARQLAGVTGKDARLVEWVLRESRDVSRAGPNVLVTRHRLGFVSANSGIDQSNVGQGSDVVLLLPVDPDASAERLRAALQARTGAKMGVVISDTHGRPFRVGNVGVAIGVAGLPAVLDLRGTADLFGRVMQVSVLGYADLVASAAHLVCGEGNEGLPVTLVRGLDYPPVDGRASDLNRLPAHDLYR
jgi:coenzyme F420-0:L-glutamate ligase/coenzyme F420-1:gamma-L-glutamate ligase